MTRQALTSLPSRSLGSVLSGVVAAAGPGAAHAQPLAPPPATSTKPVPLRRITKRADFAAQLDILKKIAALCRDNGIELVLVASPLHRANEILYDPADFADAVGQISRIAPIWDFTGSGSLTDRPGLWMADISHFSPELSRMMLRRIFADDISPGWTGFGRLRGR